MWFMKYRTVDIKEVKTMNIKEKYLDQMRAEVKDINRELEVINLDEYDEATLLILRDILITARQNIFLNNKCHKVKDYINGVY